MQTRKKTVINYWFRHFVFFIFHFSPDLVLAAKLGGRYLSVDRGTVPYFLLASLLGYYFFIRPMDSIEKPSGKDRLKGFKLVVWGLLPIILAISINLFFNVGLGYLMSLALVILFFQNYREINLFKAATMIKESFSFKLVVAVIGIMFFREVLNLADSLK